MTESTPLPRVPTRVGHARHGDNRFRGHSVHDDLTGALPYWSLIAVAVGHAPLGPEACALLDALSVATCAADPRIWPLKVVRLGSAHGSPTMGLCAALLATDGVHGPRVSVRASEFLLAMREQVGDDADDEALRVALAPHLVGAHARVPGFGVPVRGADERVVAFDDWCTRTGRVLGPHWRLLRRIEAAFRAHSGPAMNISGATAAVMLDVGFTPAQMHLPTLFVLIQNFVANAVEGAAQAPEVLRELPSTVVQYVGAPPRRSPKAL